MKKAKTKAEDENGLSFLEKVHRQRESEAAVCKMLDGEYADYLEYSTKNGRCPVEFLQDYCRIEELRKSFKPLGAADRALRVALYSLRKGMFEDIKGFLSVKKGGEA